ncbi:MAG TPA: sugar ABC transporter permease [Thermomicrobiales bacterium]|nr:sugar ABC transporter permease [Thermomicrobiales bacterium]
MSRDSDAIRGDLDQSLEDESPEDALEAAPGPIAAIALPAGRRRRTRLTQTQTRTAWLLLIPTLLVVALVALVPLVQTIYYSFTNARLASPQPTEFVGLENYRDLISDSVFRRSIFTTVRFMVITIVFEFALGLLIALVVNSNFRGRGPMRAAMLIPWAIPTVVSARMWAWMYNDVYGVVNDLLHRRLGIIDRNIAWIAEPQYSLAAVAAVDIWKTTPFVALLLLAGLQVIPNDVYEAATVDGASKVQQFFTITLPLLKPAILVTLIFRTLDALRVFDVFYVMFGERRDTQTMAVYAQQQIVNHSKTGYGSTVAVGIFLIIGIFVVAYVTTLKVDES